MFARNFQMNDGPHLLIYMVHKKQKMLKKVMFQT